jgi:hypothetical protein
VFPKWVSHPRYVDVSVNRCQKFTGKKARLDGDSRTFDEIAAERCGRDISVPPEENLRIIPVSI